MPEIPPLMLSGSIVEHIPTYNDLFNNGKLKVFPLQSLEQLVTDPSKFEHTLTAVRSSLSLKQKLRKQQKLLMKREINLEQHKQAISDLSAAQTIGSKYRFQKSSVSVADLHAEARLELQRAKEK